MLHFGINFKFFIVLFFFFSTYKTKCSKTAKWNFWDLPSSPLTFRYIKYEPHVIIHLWILSFVRTFWNWKMHYLISLRRQLRIFACDKAVKLNILFSGWKLKRWNFSWIHYFNIILLLKKHHSENCFHLQQFTIIINLFIQEIILL